MPHVLVLSHPMDLHATAVVEGLTSLGVKTTYWHTSDFPSIATESVSFEGSTREIELPGVLDSLDEVTAIWMRRPRFILPDDRLHPADRQFARGESARFRAGLYHLLTGATDALAVNPWPSVMVTENKLWQHQCAVRAGLEMPASLYTNDPASIRRFIETHGGQAVYKPFSGVQWETDGRAFGCYTNAITAETLVSDEVLALTPGIYQELVPKKSELRVTIIGERLFTARLDSQATRQGKIDWRRSYEDLVVERSELPEDVRKATLRLMNQLGIVFGCVDFIVTPEGRHVFLEVNQAGQFLFMEQYTGYPLLDAFCEMLRQGRVDFTWSEETARLRYEDMRSRLDEIIFAEAEHHVEAPYPSIREA